MGKLTNLNNLDKLSKALDARYKELINEEKARALAEEQALQVEINATKDMFGGKSIRYVTQAEYDALTEEERNSSEITYFITDAVDLSHDHENKEFLDNLAARNIAIGNKSQSFDGVNDLVYSIEDIGAAPAIHNHDDLYYTETEIDAKIEDINETINNQVTEISASLEYLDGAKANTSDALAIFIQSILSQEGESYDAHTLVKGEKLISPLVNTNTVVDDDGTTLTLYLSYFDTSINNLSSSIGNGDELLTDAKDSIVSCINELQTEINNLDTELDTKIEDINETINEQVAGLQASIANKADQSYVDEKLEVVDALTLNGYSIWVGTTAELEAIETRDPNTLYFEIGDETETGDEVVQVDIVDNILQLTADKYQKTNMVDGAEIIFPSVNKFTEIHLYFAADSNMNISLPDNCKWRVEPNIEEGNSYEIIATYNTIEWLVNVIVYS